MKQRLHQYLVTCDGCNKSVIVMHVGAYEPPTKGYPPDWNEFPVGDSDHEGGPGATLDFCPECSQQWGRDEIR